VPGLGGRNDYLVLTYYWGDAPDHHRLTTQTLHRYFSLPGIRDSELPRTIVDAVHITRRLGFRYLWVDSLCIIQDDNLNWQKESSTMSEVYSNAYCTISATGSANSSEGCFMERTGLSMLPVRPTRLYQEEDDDKTGMGLTMLTPNLP